MKRMSEMVIWILIVLLYPVVGQVDLGTSSAGSAFLSAGRQSQATVTLQQQENHETRLKLLIYEVLSKHVKDMANSHMMHRLAHGDSDDLSRLQEHLTKAIRYVNSEKTKLEQKLKNRFQQTMAKVARIVSTRPPAHGVDPCQFHANEEQNIISSMIHRLINVDLNDLNAAITELLVHQKPASKNRMLIDTANPLKPEALALIGNGMVKLECYEALSLSNKKAR